MLLPNAERWLALDTSVFIDLGDGDEVAHRCRECALEHGRGFALPPTALAESLHHQKHARDAVLRVAAETALRRRSEWAIHPLELPTLAKARAIEALAARLRERGWLREFDYRDSLILAETSVAGIPVLVVSDNDFPRHNDLLRLTLLNTGANPVAVYAPEQLNRFFRTGRL
ncbi:MAG: PIN domain-containing protein [Verrucomicrobia bacterium]|nr:PIN domain-containing protein [Verrucomicrobiota bacterium]